MKVERWQLVLAALTLAGTLLLAVWGAGVTFGGTREMSKIFRTMWRV